MSSVLTSDPLPISTSTPPPTPTSSTLDPIPTPTTSTSSTYAVTTTTKSSTIAPVVTSTTTTFNGSTLSSQSHHSTPTVSPPVPPLGPGQDEASGVSPVVLASSIVGGVVLLLIVILGIVFCLKGKKKRSTSNLLKSAPMPSMKQDLPIQMVASVAPAAVLPRQKSNRSTRSKPMERMERPSMGDTYYARPPISADAYAGPYPPGQALYRGDSFPAPQSESFAGYTSAPHIGESYAAYTSAPHVGESYQAYTSAPHVGESYAAYTSAPHDNGQYVSYAPQEPFTSAPYSRSVYTMPRAQTDGGTTQYYHDGYYHEHYPESQYDGIGQYYVNEHGEAQYYVNERGEPLTQDQYYHGGYYQGDQYYYPEVAPGPSTAQADEVPVDGQGVLSPQKSSKSVSTQHVEPESSNLTVLAKDVPDQSAIVEVASKVDQSTVVEVASNVDPSTVVEVASKVDPHSVVEVASKVDQSTIVPKVEPIVQVAPKVDQNIKVTSKEVKESGEPQVDNAPMVLQPPPTIERQAWRDSVLSGYDDSIYSHHQSESSGLVLDHIRPMSSVGPPKKRVTDRRSVNTPFVMPTTPPRAFLQGEGEPVHIPRPSDA